MEDINLENILVIVAFIISLAMVTSCTLEFTNIVYSYKTEKMQLIYGGENENRKK